MTTSILLTKGGRMYWMKHTRPYIKPYPKCYLKNTKNSILFFLSVSNSWYNIYEIYRIFIIKLSSPIILLFCFFFLFLFFVCFFCVYFFFGFICILCFSKTNELSIRQKTTTICHNAKFVWLFFWTFLIISQFLPDF